MTRTLKLQLMVIAFSGAITGMPAMAASDAVPPTDQVPIAAPTERADWRALIEPLADRPEILTKDWSATRAVLPAGCFQNASNGNVDCPPMDGVVKISVAPGPLGIIDIVLKKPATCDALYDVLSKRFGKGELENSDKCYAEWKLGKRVKHGHVSLSPGRKDPSLLYLQFAIEQGP
ncbi:hypothetical protein [Ideonella dechloratans]|uniref:hypothetical protein n=1 Tax=Ideonella dechloratans TaxID=36863 RepID=UPI0035AE33D0